jgi:excisionase family DNA binding protein
MSSQEGFSSMDIELPDRITAETIQQAQAAVTVLHMMLEDDALPAGLTAEAVDALLAITEGVARAAAEDTTDLSPSEAADRLRMARPSVMRLIARGELSSRKDGGHYVLSPRELRSFQARLALVRREALTDLATLVDEFGF